MVISLQDHTIGKGVNRKEPIVIREGRYYPKDKFMIASHYSKYIESVIIPKGLVVDRVDKLAMDIRNTYGDEPLHLLCVLKGARSFFTELCSALSKIHKYSGSYTQPPYFEHYVRLERENSVNVQVVTEDLSMLAGQNVLIVEDVFDSGHKLHRLVKELQDVKPKSVKTAALLEKQTLVSIGIKADFAGFDIPDLFVVGYSLDYNEAFRDLNHISILNAEGLAKFTIPAQGPAFC